MSSEKDNNIKLIKLISLIRIIAIITMLIIFFVTIVRLLPGILDLLKSGSEKDVEQYIAKVGKNGWIIMVVLQFLQTITIVFPGIPIYMASGIIYGRIKGTLICYLTYVVSNVVIFFFSRRMGEAAEQLFQNKKQWGVAELMNKTKSPAIFVSLLCIVPVIPNGIIPHIAARSKLTLRKFFAAVAIGCIPGIFLFVCCGNLLLEGRYEIIILMIVLSVIGAIVIFVFKNKLINWISGKIAGKSNQEQE